eukprot:352158-Chlamydomonas_euryale.AAC.3
MASSMLLSAPMWLMLQGIRVERAQRDETVQRGGTCDETVQRGCAVSPGGARDMSSRLSCAKEP